MTGKESRERLNAIGYDIQNQEKESAYIEIVTKMAERIHALDVKLSEMDRPLRRLVAR